MNEKQAACKKCLKVIESCQTVEQAIVASHMVDNYVKYFNYPRNWLELNSTATSKIFSLMKGETK